MNLKIGHARVYQRAPKEIRVFVLITMIFGPHLESALERQGSETDRSLGSSV